MRARISERNYFPNFSPKEEYFKLHHFLCDNSAFAKRGLYDDTYHSIYELLDKNFTEWSLIGSFTTLEEMMRKFHIRTIDVSDSFSEDGLLDYIQFIINALGFLSNHVYYPFRSYRFNSIQESILKHCELLLKKLNAEVIEIEDEYVVLYKSDVATVVSNQQPELATSITEYLAINNRSDLQQKEEILCSLAKALEPKEQLLKENGFQQLCKDATFLLNKTGARHALDPNDGIEAQFLAMDAADRIKWYDRAFKTVLACMAVLPYIDFKDEIKDIKRNG